MGKPAIDVDGIEEPAYGTVEELGYEQVYRRVFKTVVNVALVLAFSSPLTAILIVGAYPITYGGYWGLTWGWFVPAVIFFPQAIAISELASSMPINGTFYWWTAALAPRTLSRPLSFAFGWFNMLSGFTTMASFAWAIASALGGAIGMLEPGWAATNVQTMGMAFGFTLLWASLTLMGTEKIGNVFLACAFVVLAMFVVFVISLPATHAAQGLPFADASLVFGQYTNSSDWEDGVAVPISWFAAVWTITGWPYPAFLAEETLDAPRRVPKAIMVSYLSSAGMGLVTLIVIAFCLDDLSAALTDETGYPLYTQLMTHWGAKKLGAFLLVGVVVITFGGSSLLFSFSSQMAAFARDGGFPASHVFARVHKKTNMPLAAIGLATAGTLLILLLGLSKQASTIIYSLAVIALFITYMVPISLRLVAGTRFVPGAFYTGNLSLPIHAWALASSTYMVIMLSFPTTKAWTATTFNYNWVVAASAAVICCAAWFTVGMRSYKGPDLDAIEARANEAQNSKLAAT